LIRRAALGAVFIDGTSAFGGNLGAVVPKLHNFSLFGVKFFFYPSHLKGHPGSGQHRLPIFKHGVFPESLGDDRVFFMERQAKPATAGSRLRADGA
jgi:hypothetical protein